MSYLDVQSTSLGCVAFNIVPTKLCLVQSIFFKGSHYEMIFIMKYVCPPQAMLSRSNYSPFLSLYGKV